METAFTKAFNTQYNAMASARARVRSGQHIAERCMTSGIRETRTDSDYGQGVSVAADVRLLLEDEFEDGLMRKGKRVEVEHAGSEGWKEYRIGERTESAGVLVLTLEDPNE